MVADPGDRRPGQLPDATDEKQADQCLVRVGRGGSRTLLFPRECADELTELIDALQTATLCECVIHGCGTRD